MKKTLLVLAVLIVAAASRTLAGQLDVAVILFPEPKTAEELTTALAGLRLTDIADADRTQTSVSYLQGAYVKALVSIAVPRGAYFATKARLGVYKSNFVGHLGDHSISGQLDVIEGVKGGIRSFLKGSYPVNGSLPTGSPVVLSLVGIHTKVTTVSKDDQVATKKYFYTSVVMAQYTH